MPGGQAGGVYGAGAEMEVVLVPGLSEQVCSALQSRPGAVLVEGTGWVLMAGDRKLIIVFQDPRLLVWA